MNDLYTDAKRLLVDRILEREEWLEESPGDSLSDMWLYEFKLYNFILGCVHRAEQDQKVKDNEMHPGNITTRLFDYGIP